MNKMAKWLLLSSLFVATVNVHGAEFDSSEWRAELAQQMKVQVSDAVANVQADQVGILKDSLKQANKGMVAEVTRQQQQHQMLAQPASEAEALLVTSRRDSD